MTWSGPPGPAGPRRFGPLSSITARIVALTLGAVLVTSLVGAAISVLLVQRANDQAAAATLGGLADSAQAVAALAPSPEVGQARAAKALDGVRVQVAVVRTDTPRGTVVTGDALARRATNADLLAKLARGEAASIRVTTDDGRIFVEARPTAAGGIVLAQRRTDAVAIGQAAVAQLLWAFGGVAALALGVGWLVARRVGAPLRRTAAAATELAAGRRDVAVVPRGPTEVAAVATAVNDLARSLAHSEARQREFLLSVSHDLRTPLTTVRGYAESLADGVVPAEQVTGVGRLLEGEAGRLERMVGDLLDLARLDAQEATVRAEEVSVRDVVRAAEPPWRLRCDAVGVPLTVLLADGDPLVVVGDADRLRQALDGLVDNALRATPAGCPIVVTAYRTAEPPGSAPPESAPSGSSAREPAGLGGAAGWVVLQVRDGGPGLRPEDYSVAFDRSVLYERYRGLREVGTGLGLAIVARIVARHGGSVAAGPAPEGGAAFTLTVPAGPRGGFRPG